MPQGPHVLLIDHSQEVLDQFQRLLEREGFRVTPSRTLLNQRQLLALNPDVIVQEIFAVGGLEVGWQYLSLLRRDPAIAGIPVVLCTTAADLIRNPERAEYLAELGVRVLIKPISITYLVTAIAEVLAAERLIDPPLESS